MLAVAKAMKSAGLHTKQESINVVLTSKNIEYARYARSSSGFEMVCSNNAITTSGNKQKAKRRSRKKAKAEFTSRTTNPDGSTDRICSRNWS